MRPLLTSALVALGAAGCLGLAVTLVAGELSTGFSATYQSQSDSTTIRVADAPDTAALDPGCRRLPHAVLQDLPPLAVITGTRLRVVTTEFCVVTTALRAGASWPVAESADGDWIGYGAGHAVSRDGVSIVQPLGLNVWSRGDRPTWAWSPAGNSMAGITVQSAVRFGTPGQAPRTLLPDGWGATEIAFAGPDRLVVARGNSLWQIDTATGEPSLLYAAPSAEARVSLASAAAGWVVFWQQPSLSASAATDGAPLLALSLDTRQTTRLASSVIIRPASVTHCGDGVAVSVGAGRDATTDKTIEVFRADDWRARTVGPGVSPTCSADGRRIAYSVGPVGAPIGRERRDVVVRDLGAARTTTVYRSGPRARAATDEAPLLLRDGRAVVWVRTTYGAGTLMIAALPSSAAPRTAVLTAIGRDDSSYGSYDWPSRFAQISPMS